MAKIMGFEVKNVKDFKDHEGFIIHQGNVYFNNKKIGSWSQDDWGGCDRYDFNVTPYNEAIANSDWESYPMFDGCKKYGFAPDLDILLEEVIRLRDREKMYKKLVKNGFPKMTAYSNGYETCFVGSQKTEDKTTDDAVASIAERMGWKKDDDIDVEVYDECSFCVGSPVKLA